MFDGIQPKYLTIKQACAYSGLSRTRVYENLYQFMPKKCGARTLISVEALDAWLEALPNAPVRPPSKVGTGGRRDDCSSTS